MRDVGGMESRVFWWGGFHHEDAKSRRTEEEMKGLKRQRSERRYFGKRVWGMGVTFAALFGGCF